jgi:hypothetical protein
VCRSRSSNPFSKYGTLGFVRPAERSRFSSAAFKGEKDKSDQRFKPSVDWSKYKTAEECRRPNSMAVVAVTPVQCRSTGKEAEHAPISEGPNGANRAHTDICDPLGKPMTHRENSVASGKLAECAVVSGS